MCQIVISEKSVPAHIAGWLNSKAHPNKEIVVMGDPSDPIVRQCLDMARDKGIDVAKH